MAVSDGQVEIFSAIARYADGGITISNRARRPGLPVLDRDPVYRYRTPEMSQQDQHEVKK